MPPRASEATSLWLIPGLKLLASGENPQLLAEVGTGKSTVALSIAGALAPERFARTAAELARVGLDPSRLRPVSRTLIEELQWDNARVTSLDWKSYPILTFPDVPDVVIDLIDRPSERPWGAGEPAAAVVPSAVANAIYDAVGVRMRSVPFTPDKVLAALKSA